MPLTKNAINHIRRQYRRAWKGRTIMVELRYVDREPRIVEGIFKLSDTADPELGPATSAAISHTAQASDAAFEVLLGSEGDITLAELQSAISVRPATSFEGAQQTPAAGSRYLIVEVQPKGTAWPPNRAYVLLRRV